MLALYRTLSLRYLGRRWFRALLIVASIALGVATLVATRTLNDTMTRAVLASHNPLMQLRYPGVTGIKTGYSPAAGLCFVGTARRGATELGVVLLNSPQPGAQASALLDRVHQGLDPLPLVEELLAECQ